MTHGPVAQDNPRTRRFGNHPDRLPPWLRKSLARGREADATDQLIAEFGLHTICRSGRCPNRNECYSQKTATFMIMGDRCTRNCHYCSVTPGKPLPLDTDEPNRIIKATQALGLKHVVITSVTRDDLPDEGLEHFSRVIHGLRTLSPDLIIEALTPDFRRDPERGAQTLSRMPLDIFNHNIETVREQHRRMRPQGGYDLSLHLLKRVGELNPRMIIKSGAMLGMGETAEQVRQMLLDLRQAGCQMLTLGQYLQPEVKAYPVVRYVEPEEFKTYGALAKELGFRLVESGPFVRSSYHAKDSFEALIRHTQERKTPHPS